MESIAVPRENPVMVQPNREETLESILRTGVMAVLRLESIGPLQEVAGALLAGGVSAIEITMTTPDALEGVRLLGREFPAAVVGVGTVLDVAACRAAADAGARYMVSPHFDPDVVAVTRDLGCASFPGAFTPTEILGAWRGGADVVKVFPSAGAGPTYLRDVLAPLPFLKLMPTGGVEPKNVGEWVRMGAACVGAGTLLVPKRAVAEGDWAAITANARGLVEGVAAARGRK